MRFGFFNVPLVVIVLLTAWILWCDFRHHPVGSVALLFGAATIGLAAWAPLVVVPLSLACVAVLLGWRSVLARPGWRTLVVIGGALQLGGYLLLVTAPDILRSSGALAAHGGVPPLKASGFVFVLVFTLAAIGLGQRHDFLRILTLVVSGSAGVAYLVWQRRGAAGLWRYYPGKFAWLVCILLVIAAAAAAASALRWMAHRRFRGARSVLVLGLAGVVVPACTVIVPPGERTVAGTVPLLAVAMNPVVSPGVEALFSHTDGTERVILDQYSAVSADDAFADFWLFQLWSQTSEDPVREFAYTLDLTDVAAVCAAVTTWIAPVDVVTRGAALASQLKLHCPNREIVVSVVN